MAIDRFRYPWLHRVARGADWLGSQEFDDLVAQGGGGLWETWLDFVFLHHGLSEYLPRLRGPKEQCAIAFREIAVAHFLATECRVRILGWQVPCAHGTLGEFLVGPDPRHPIFVEVKSPRWQAEIAREHGDEHPRLKMPKYVGVEARFTNPWDSVDYSIAKAYGKMPGDKPSLLVINDDLYLPLADWASTTGDIALYRPKSRLLPEGGAFVDDRYNRLGAVGVLKTVDFDPSRGVIYAFTLFDNPHALPCVMLAPNFAQDYPRYNGAKAPP